MVGRFEVLVMATRQTIDDKTLTACTKWRLFWYFAERKEATEDRTEHEGFR